MKSFLDLDRTFASQPPRLGVVLARIDLGRGREALFRSQQPHVLRRLEQSTRVESITASNAIENITVDLLRAERIVRNSEAVRFRNRNEEEFAGYRDAVTELTQGNGDERLSVPLLLHIHRTLYKHSGGGGGRIKTDQNFIVEYIDGQRHVIFTPPSPLETQSMLPELVDRFNEAVETQRAHPLILIATFILDLLAIHPVADGNGRLARLIAVHLMLAQGYRISRYASIEHNIYETKTRYYDALRESQRNWHTAEHSIWPFVAYLCEMISYAYDQFEESIAAAEVPTGTKQEHVRECILNHAPQPFRFRDLEMLLPAISVPTIRLVLNTMSSEGLVQSEGHGAGARWSLVPK